eukprot:scaffold125875_cov63-Phaeocystis_antarctica.AAC.4
MAAAPCALISATVSARPSCCWLIISGVSCLLAHGLRAASAGADVFSIAWPGSSGSASFDFLKLRKLMKDMPPLGDLTSLAPRVAVAGTAAAAVSSALRRTCVFVAGTSSAASIKPSLASASTWSGVSFGAATTAGAASTTGAIAAAGAAATAGASAAGLSAPKVLAGAAATAGAALRTVASAFGMIVAGTTTVPFM